MAMEKSAGLMVFCFMYPFLKVHFIIWPDAFRLLGTYSLSAE
ncbi:hypothetical protein SALWKB2_1526 [Snodgrassella alvi wkB2]|nr:hypothetical protein SALWKB2_1526 [Snodgrassella alvi wkB2]